MSKLRSPWKNGGNSQKVRILDRLAFYNIPISYPKEDNGCS